MKPLETRTLPVPALPNFDPTDPRLPPYVALRLDVLGTMQGDSLTRIMRSFTIVWKRSKDLWYVTDGFYRGSTLAIGAHTREDLTAALPNETNVTAYKVDEYRLTRLGRLDTIGALVYGSNQNLLHWFNRSTRAARLCSTLVGATRGVVYAPYAMRGGRRFTAADWMAMRKMFTNRNLQSLVEDIADAATHRNERDLVDELRDNWHYLKYREATDLLLRNLRDDFNACLTRCDCGHVEHDDDQYVTAGGTTYCRDCGHDELEYVGGEYHHREDLYYWESDGEYHLDPEPDDDGEDDDCSLLQVWGASCSYLDHDKSFTPSPIGDFTMGVELEVEVRDTYDTSRSEVIRDCHDYFNDPRTLGEYAMFKRDGSLSDSRGFEIVTAARRLHDHIGMFMDWEPENLTSWSSGTCGMHVHIDSRAFTALSLGKFLMFYNDGRNMDIIRRVAGRHPLRDSQARSFANTLDQKDVANPAKVKKGAGTHRYRIVNLTNLSGAEQERLKQPAQRDSKGSYSTVEVRIFRGTLKKERLLAQIEFAHASVMFCRVTSWNELNEREFLKWLRANASGYKNLAQFLDVAPPPKVDKRNGQNAPSQLTLV